MVSVIVVCITVLGLIASGFLVTPVSVITGPTKPPEAKLPAKPIPFNGTSIRGNPNATVGMIEYSEFQCPFCGVFARETLPALEREYVATNRVQLVFRQFPLEAVHSFARKAAESAECAGQQGQFWPMHDLLFRDQKQLDSASLARRAKGLGLNGSQFEACLAGEAIDKIEEDIASGKSLGVGGTPTFFIGVVQADRKLKVTQRVSGAQSLGQFRAALDRALAESR